MAALDLPTGRRGQLLELGLTLAVLGGAWAGIAAPLLDWHALRADQVRRVAAPGRPAEGAVLDGASDALAAAALQGRLQEMAARAGAPLSSAEALPGEAAGTWRRIGV